MDTEHQAQAFQHLQTCDISLRSVTMKSVIFALLTTSAAGFLAKRSACSVTGVGISADMDTEHNYYSQAGGGEGTFTGAGMVKVADGNCPQTDDFPSGSVSQSIEHGAESEPSNFECSGACCVRFCRGSSTCWSS